MSWENELINEKNAATRVQQTGNCKRCGRDVRKYQKCELTLPAPTPDLPPRLTCPMREEKVD